MNMQTTKKVNIRTSSNQYTYCMRGAIWAVYDADGHKVESFVYKENARKKVYELNGWNYK